MYASTLITITYSYKHSAISFASPSNMTMRCSNNKTISKLDGSSEWWPWIPLSTYSTMTTYTTTTHSYFILLHLCPCSMGDKPWNMFGREFARLSLLCVPNFVSWANKAVDNGSVSRIIYLHVVVPSCQSCHITSLPTKFLA